MTFEYFQKTKKYDHLDFSRRAICNFPNIFSIFLRFSRKRRKTGERIAIFWVTLCFKKSPWFNECLTLLFYIDSLKNKVKTNFVHSILYKNNLRRGWQAEKSCRGGCRVHETINDMLQHCFIIRDLNHARHDALLHHLSIVLQH